MVNVTYTESSSDMIYTADDGTQYLYNLGDMSFSESHHQSFSFDFPFFHSRQSNNVADTHPISLVIVAMALVWIMVPGVGLFYSGLLRRKNALSMIFLSMAGVAVGSFQWFFWGKLFHLHVTEKRGKDTGKG